MDLKKLEKRIEDGLITKRKHPTEDLWIYNYTPKCQFDRLWDQYTLMCRGLILNKKGDIIARPFKKFFNLGEHEGTLPDGEFKIYDKLDGSLGILYWIGKKIYIATRGSFESEQAIKGTEILRKYERAGDIYLPYNKTYLFEIIYPGNRIVIDYKGREDLILLAVIDTLTGDEEDLHEFCINVFPSADEVNLKINNNKVSDLNRLKDFTEDNAEGFVIKWRNGLRLKVKFDEYVRLHRLITGITERRIWDMLRNEESLDELLERVPDEFYKWVKGLKEKLEKEYTYIKDKATEHREHVSRAGGKDGREYRKNQAMYLQKYCKKYSGIVFAMLDGKDYKSKIWRMLKPDATKPFKVEI